MSNKTFIIALTGASASGKTTIANVQCDTFEDSYRWKQLTTRKARSSFEEYIFANEEFVDVLKANNLLTCYTEFNNNNKYGTVIESFAPRLVYVVVSPEGLLNLLADKDKIEVQLSKSIEILPVNVVYNISEQSLLERGRNRSVDFVRDEARKINELDVDWFLTINSDEMDVRRPQEFRELLEQKLSKLEFNRLEIIEEIQSLPDDKLLEIFQSLQNSAKQQMTVESFTDTSTDEITTDSLFDEDEEKTVSQDSLELDLDDNSYSDDNEESLDTNTAEFDFLNEIDNVIVEKVDNVDEEVSQPKAEPESLAKMRKEIEEQERLKREEIKQQEIEEKVQETVDNNVNRKFSIDNIKRSFPDDFLDFVAERGINLMSLADSLVLESQLAGYLRARNMSKDEVEAPETIQVHKIEDQPAYLTSFEISIQDKFISRLTLDTETNTIS